MKTWIQYKSSRLLTKQSIFTWKKIQMTFACIWTMSTNSAWYVGCALLFCFSFVWFWFVLFLTVWFVLFLFWYIYIVILAALSRARRAQSCKVRHWRYQEGTLGWWWRFRCSKRVLEVPNFGACCWSRTWSTGYARFLPTFQVKTSLW